MLEQKFLSLSPLETKVVLWLLKRICLIAGPRIRTREVPYAAQPRAYGLQGVPR
jgi:hypothetical protein